jgi:hypothetical protein
MEIDGHGRKGRKTDRNGMRMDAMTIKQLNNVVYSKANNYRKITIELLKLPRNHRERRTRFPETKYFYPTLIPRSNIVSNDR